MNTRPRQDIHAEVTNRLIAAIESNPGEPVMPWRKSGKPLWLPQNALTRNRYNGINIVSLWVAAETAGYAEPLWATYRQWQQLDAQVRKGERASPVVFYKQYDTDPDPDDPEDDGKRRLARASWVFNCTQVEGYTPPPQPEPLGPIQRIFDADRFFTAIGARIVHGGQEAYYRPSTDTIHMPDEGLFTGTSTMTRSEAYFAVLAHEHIHYTGHDSRLDRNLAKRFGNAEVAAEELVAEVGAAILCAELGSLRMCVPTTPSTRELVAPSERRSQGNIHGGGKSERGRELSQRAATRPMVARGPIRRPGPEACRTCRSLDARSPG